MWSQVTLGIFRVSNKVCCKKLIVFCYLLYQSECRSFYTKPWQIFQLTVRAQLRSFTSCNSCHDHLRLFFFLSLYPRNVWLTSVAGLNQVFSLPIIFASSPSLLPTVFTFIIFFVRALSLSLARENVLLVESTWIVIRGHAVWKSISDKRPDC